MTKFTQRSFSLELICLHCAHVSPRHRIIVKVNLEWKRYRDSVKRLGAKNFFFIVHIPPPHRKAFFTSLRPMSAQICRTVAPPESKSPGSAPACTRWTTAAPQPLAAAMIKGVNPCLLRGSGLAPSDKSFCTVAALAWGIPHEQEDGAKRGRNKNHFSTHGQAAADGNPNASRLKKHSINYKRLIGCATVVILSSA